MRTLEVQRTARIPYGTGLSLMESAAARLRAGDPPQTDRLLLLEHPPVLTIGRGANRADVVASPEWLASRGIEIHEVDRGGAATYHGPGQVVGYPIVDLRDRPDVRRFVHDLEEAMILTCADFGVDAGRDARHRGAWVGPRKIGAVGVRVEGWITTHGFALNVAPDLSLFGAIVPCGITDPTLGVTSLAAELRGRGLPAPPLPDVEARLAHHLAQVLGRGLALSTPVRRGGPEDKGSRHANGCTAGGAGEGRPDRARTPPEGVAPPRGRGRGGS